MLGDLVRRLAELRVVAAREEQVVHPRERPEPLDLDALPGVVLPRQPAPGEAHAVPVGQQRAVLPPVGVAADRQHQVGQARSRHEAARGHLVRAPQHPGEVGAAAALELLQGAARAAVLLGVLSSLRVVERARGAQPVQLAGNRRVAPGSAAGLRRSSRRSGVRRRQEAVPLGAHETMPVEDQDGPGARRGGDARKRPEERQDQGDNRPAKHLGDATVPRPSGAQVALHRASWNARPA